MRWIKTYESFVKVQVNTTYLKKFLGATSEYKINEDDTIDVYGDVKISGSGLKCIPFNFNKVTGNFDCSNNDITSLIGSPKEVGGRFKCSQNRLLNLNYAPIEVGGDFECWNNHIETLDGCPLEIGGNFMCMGNKIKTLDIVSSISGNLDCRDNLIDKENTGFNGWCGGEILLEGNK